MYMSLSAAWLGACTLDTTPETAATRAPAIAQAQLAEQRDPNEPPASVPIMTGAAGAPGATHTEASMQPKAAMPQTEAEAEAEPADQTDADAENDPSSGDRGASESDDVRTSDAEAEAAAMAQAEPSESDSNEEHENERSATAPMANASCQPGRYTGLISGTVNLGGIVGVSTLAGTVSLELIADRDNANTLVVKQGRLEGVDTQWNKFSADVTGAVDCATGQLLSNVERGTFGDATQPAPLEFSGAAPGEYSAQPPALVGTWVVVDTSLLLAGQGTWSTALEEAY